MGGEAVEDGRPGCGSGRGAARARRGRERAFFPLLPLPASRFPLPASRMIRYLTAGESHGPALVGIVEGMPAGVPLLPAHIDAHLARRWKGAGRGGRAVFEVDTVQILGGVRFGHTTGAPVALLIPNAAYESDRAGWPETMAVEGTGEGVARVTLPRPGHADLAGAQKYGFDRPPHGPDIRPVIERSSARETAMRVACCSVARQMLAALGIHVGSHVLRIGSVGVAHASEAAEARDALLARGAHALSEAADASPVRMLDAAPREAAVAHVDETKKAGDTLGGVYEVVATGVPVGLGSYAQADRRLDGRLAGAILSIQAQKAVEVGDGQDGGTHPGLAGPGPHRAHRRPPLPDEQPRRRRRGRHLERDAGRRARHDEAHPDAHPPAPDRRPGDGRGGRLALRALGRDERARSQHGRRGGRGVGARRGAPGALRRRHVRDASRARRGGPGGGVMRE